VTPLSETQSALVRRAKALVVELGDFLTAREMSESEGRDYLIREVKEFQTTYATEYAGRVLALTEAFKEEGIQPPKDYRGEFMMEHPTNPLGLRSVMTTLSYMAEKLELRD